MNHALSRKFVAFRWPGYANKFLLVILMGVTGHSIEQVWSRKYKGLFIWSLLFAYFIKNPDYSHFSCFERICENMHDYLLIKIIRGWHLVEQSLELQK